MLDYSVPSFQFLIGGFDASQYLDSISLSVPMHEPGQPLLWSGQFKVSNNLRAMASGLTDSDFSEFANPSRWRPYQQQIRLNIRGILSPVFRIENYRYNAQTAVGEGMLTQIPAAVAGDRPGVSIATTVSGNIGTAIEQLITAAFAGATVQPGRALAGDGGVLDVPIITRNSWGDAARLSGLSWSWLTVNGSESIVTVSGTSNNLVFTRTPEQVELVPDLAAIYQSAQKVIVTGARQVADTSAADPTDPNQTPTAPRPKIKKTQEFRPAGVVFTSLAPSINPVLFEDKTIMYQYWDDDSIPDLLPGFLYDIQSVTQSGINIYAPPPPDLNIPMQTITIKRQPLGFLFPSLGVNASLTVAEMIVESNLRKLTIKPVGVLFNSTDATLAIEKRETLTTALIPPGRPLVRPTTNAGGTTQQYEARPKLEPQQPIATRPLKTEVLKGEAQLSPLGWVPVLAKPLVVDFGFLPDNARANLLAHKIAVREQQRRDQVLVDMPIPIEWLANGWPLLSSCQIGGDRYLMDGVAISIADGVAKFGFTGGLISKGGTVIINGVPTAVQVPQYQTIQNLDAGVRFELEVVSVVGVESSAEIIFELIIEE